MSQDQLWIESAILDGLTENLATELGTFQLKRGLGLTLAKRNIDGSALQKVNASRYAETDMLLLFQYFVMKYRKHNVKFLCCTNRMVDYHCN